MGRSRTWVVEHRKGLVIAITLVLGVLMPLPGYILASVFWSAGIHDIDSTLEGIVFVAVVLGLSGMSWALVAHAVLPRRPPPPPAPPRTVPPP